MKKEFFCKMLASHLFTINKETVTTVTVDLIQGYWCPNQNSIGLYGLTVMNTSTTIYLNTLLPAVWDMIKFFGTTHFYWGTLI